MYKEQQGELTDVRMEKVNRSCKLNKAKFVCQKETTQVSNTPGTTHINPLVRISDQDRISPYNISDNIEQTSDENKEKYHLKDYQLIQYQILKTNIRRTVLQTVRRITNEIFGVKRLIGDIVVTLTSNCT